MYVLWIYIFRKVFVCFNLRLHDCWTVFSRQKHVIIGKIHLFRWVHVSIYENVYDYVTTGRES